MHCSLMAAAFHFSVLSAMMIDGEVVIVITKLC